MRRSVHMARLGIALVSFVNATAALAAPGIPAPMPAGAVLASAATVQQRLAAKVQRPPRVPRREPFVADPSTALAADA